MTDTVRTIALTNEEIRRLADGGRVLTSEFDHLSSVNLVHEKDKRKWIEHERDEHRGDTIYVDNEDIRRLEYSVVGWRPADDIHIYSKNKYQPDRDTGK